MLNGAAVTEAGELVQPPTLCVTVYAPAVVTVTDDVVAPVDHTGLVPVVESTELPQLFVTEAEGAAGTGVVVTVIDAHVILDSFTHPAPSSPRT